MLQSIDEIKLTGRGGQGIVSAGEILARAADAAGLWAQSIPTFGPERRGGPAACSLRLSDEPILIKAQVTAFDQLICFDPSLWKQFPVFAGLRPGGLVLLDTTMAPPEAAALLAGDSLPRPPNRPLTLHTLDATGLALEILGRPITSTAMLAAWGAASRRLPAEALRQVVSSFFPEREEANLRVMAAAVKALSPPLAIEEAT